MLAQVVNRPPPEGWLDINEEMDMADSSSGISIDLGHVAAAVGGAALVAAAAPTVLAWGPVVALGAAVGLPVAGIATGAISAVGGWLGYKAADKLKAGN